MLSEERQIINEILSSKKIKKHWGQDHEGSDYVVEQIHGDGKQLFWFQSMDSRPFGYYIWVDSSVKEDEFGEFKLSPSDQEIYNDFPEMLMQMIEEECDNIDNYHELDSGLYTNDQDIAEGIPPIKYEFPMFSISSGGYYWSKVDLDQFKNELKIIKE